MIYFCLQLMADCSSMIYASNLPDFDGAEWMDGLDGEKKCITKAFGWLREQLKGKFCMS